VQKRSIVSTYVNLLWRTQYDRGAEPKSGVVGGVSSVQAVMRS